MDLGYGKEMFELICHPSAPPLAIRSVTARLIDLANSHWLGLRWRVEGSGKVVLPLLAGRKRRDNLWQRTCFELFLKPSGEAGYSEFNFSPSESWAAYDFAGQRTDRRDRAMALPPKCVARVGGDVLIFDAHVPRQSLPHFPAAMGITAVIEEEGGTLSYWSLKHSGNRPDFHDPACFTATLAAPHIP